MFQSAFFKDKLILLLGLIQGLLGLFNILSVMLRTVSSRQSPILRYWNYAGADEFDRQASYQLYGFAIFAIIVMLTSVYVSYRVYDRYRPAAYVAFILAHLVLIFNIIVSGAILNLQQ